MTNLQKLQTWCDERVRTHGLREIFFFPGSDAPNIDIEMAAGAALELIEGWDTGMDATES